MTTLDALLTVLSLPVAAAAAYLFVLTLLSARMAPPPRSAQRTRFDVVVPAHNEEADIAATVSSLLAMDYPAQLRRVIVVADNCTDKTAAAAAGAGALVLERQNAEKRGKGYALALAFERALADGQCDAVVVVDADTVVDANLLEAFAGRLEQGAAAIQAEYGVRNPEASWRTQLMTIAFSLFHEVRSLGRERLGVSCGLRGNGMCFSTRVLREVPHDAFSIVEDVEYGIRLAQAGHRVRFAAEAAVRGSMVVSAQASTTQRSRWEGGRSALARLHVAALLKQAVSKRSLMLLDLALDLLVPPLAQLGGVAAVGLLVAAIASLITGTSWFSLWSFLASAAMLAAYVARGWWTSGTGLGGLLALVRAPGYLAWKLISVLSRGTRGSEWVRTAREKTTR